MKQRLLSLFLVVCLGVGCFSPVYADLYDGEVDVSLIVDAGKQMFAAHEGNYDSVVCSDVGAVGMGILGWRGPRALQLLQLICEKAPDTALELLGEELYTEIVETVDLAAWNNRIFTQEEADKTALLLGTEFGITAENELAERDIQSYISYAWKAGIRSDAAILYYCSIENHYGHGGATSFMRSIRAALGITESDTINSLDEFHAAVIAAAETYSNVASTLVYRTKIYNYIKNVLGWDTAPHNVPPECEDCPGAVFTDMPPKANWAHDGIDYVVANGLFLGTSATTFTPDGKMTRAMLVTVLYRLAGQPEANGKTSFTDLVSGSYYESAVCWAAENGIVTGVSGTRFAPNEPLTREQLAAILYRYDRLCGNDPSGDSSALLVFGDSAAASNYAGPALVWAVDTGLIQGKTVDGVLMLCPKEYATRAQVAVILMRYKKAA